MITDNWEGWYLNHLAEEDSKWALDYFLKPNSLDWKVGLMDGIEIKSNLIDYKFLWIKKEFFLYKNPESEDRELLEEPIEIVEIQYDYGNWNGLYPEKQDIVFCGFYRASLDEEPQLIEYKRITNDLSKLGARDDIVTGRRRFARNWLKQRAIEIDEAIEQIISVYGVETASSMGVERVNLAQGTEKFFEEFSIIMSNYIDTGNLKINEAIQENLDSSLLPAKNDWLKKTIPVGTKEDGSLDIAIAGQAIQKAFLDAVTPI